MTVTDIIFYFVAALTVFGGVGVVGSRNVAHAALSLVFTLLSVAALYILLATEFLALVQILLYAGGVAILLLFALMLTRARDLSQTLDNSQRPLAVIAGLSLLGVLVAMVVLTAWPRAADEPALVDFEAVGDALFRTWVVPFEVASLVLLIALVGGIVLARSEEEEEEA
jgi:NADH:ubiquinone oxidoreductase subunit 6 (subunit J)